MKPSSILIYLALQCGSVVAVAQTPILSAALDASARPLTQPTKALASRSGIEDVGERKFRENCSRCHNAPEELSTRITGTVVLHMRVRASLSAEDQRAIQHYLAP
jgi:cytochrome c5